MEELNITASLEDLQTDEQRRVLDTVAQVRKCGLESILSLPQLVVCGDQSAGKSSVLEALTEIPFPRNDNLCTRYPTEIILRRGHANSLTIKIIPDSSRPQIEQERIKSFKESITDFEDLPRIMDLAMAAMGISSTVAGNSTSRAFAPDVLSIEIEGPTRPQLTVVDIPGLIQTSTKGVSDIDVDLVAEITKRYISQPRTICLAVVAATSDAANQSILRKVRHVDPHGDRTLGIITKPDRLPAGSGSESKFLELARNEDVFFKLGWHVLKNRSFEEASNSLVDRDSSEATYFRTSNFNSLPKENVGIDSLRIRLSLLLFDHIKQELPKLRDDLLKALVEAQEQLGLLGNRRSDSLECRSFLMQLSLNYYEVCKSAVNGNYEGSYFHGHTDQDFSIDSSASIARLRAVVQHMNNNFSNFFRMTGHKFWIDLSDHPTTLDPTPSAKPISVLNLTSRQPIKLSKSESLQWVQKVLIRTRGKELIGNFNPLLIGELFWEQSSKWRTIAEQHIEDVAQACERFLTDVLGKTCPKDVKSQVWSFRISDALRNRHQAAFRELDLIMEDLTNFPINYNHYYTDTIQKRRQERQKAALTESIDSATKHEALLDCYSNHISTTIDMDKALNGFSALADPNMENFSYEEVLDCLFAIYKVS